MLVAFIHSGNLFMRKRLAIFDFDGTLVKKDSFIKFGIFAVGIIKFGLAVIRTMPQIMGWKIGFTSGSSAKEKLFSNLYRDMPVDRFNELCHRFTKELESIESQEVMSDMHKHLERGDRIVIVSASIVNWIYPWAVANGIKEVIATEVQVDLSTGTLPGKFVGNNCVGEEKVKRLKEYIPDYKRYEIWSYGDSRSDRPILEIADHPIKI